MRYTIYATFTGGSCFPALFLLYHLCTGLCGIGFASLTIDKNFEYRLKMLDTSSEKFRKNMVDCQILTNGVYDERLLEAFQTIPREIFVPDRKKTYAYIDEDIEFAPGRYLLEPCVQARLIQALGLDKDKAVLDVGTGTGYSAAILSMVAKTVIALESDAELAGQGAANLDTLGLYNVAYLCEDIQDFGQIHAPYPAICINGAVEEIPEAAFQALDISGKLACVVKQRGHVMGKAVLYEKIGEGKMSKSFLFECATPYLKGFEPKQKLEFI